MGLMQQAYYTYCTLEKKHAGQYLAEDKRPLAPILHQITKADLEITLNSEGELLSARREGTSDSSIIIPVTEKSAGRTGENSNAHPLCDKICYLSPQFPEKYTAYLTQLHSWENSPFNHPKLFSIARYVEKGTILTDLQRLGLLELGVNGLPVNENDKKLFVCWRVESGLENDIAECWKDQTLFRAWIAYYESQQDPAKYYCMVSGEYTVPALQHPKNIISTRASAKLISANDSSGFTYRGRFSNDRQALTIGCEVSQKAHSALSWLIANQAVIFGKRVFLCWSPQGVQLPSMTAPILQQTEVIRKPSDYKQALYNKLKNLKGDLPADASAVIASFDAATKGRMSLTYYGEMHASDFLERLQEWDASCQWLNGPSSIMSPSLAQIVSYAFGTPQTDKGQTEPKVDEHVMSRQIQRLVFCRVNKQRIPPDIELALVRKSSNLQLFNYSARDTLLFTACAVIRKYHYDRNGEEWNMALEPDKHDISYQYGRLLAILEKIERDTYDKEESREPNAIRMQTVYTQRPLHTSRIIMEQLKNAYYRQLKPASRIYYDRLIGEIEDHISDFPEAEQNRPLGDTYLLGYYLQRNELYKSKAEEKKTEE